jgi:hypothetical protein
MRACPRRPLQLPCFNSISASVASTVLIHGNNFMGTTAVSFNGVGASFQVLNTQFVVQQCLTAPPRVRSPYPTAAVSLAARSRLPSTGL